MTLESPMLGLCLLPVAVAALWLTHGCWPTTAKWLIRLTIFLLLAAIAGPMVKRERPPKIAVMVDVSPSTRGAAFRDAQSLTARLTPLLAGRPYSIHYFADGEQPTATEPPAAQTRLTVPIDADAVLLLSDGRLSLRGESPPLFPIIDPTLDSPGDAAVRSIRQLPRDGRPMRRSDTGRFAIDVIGQPDRVLEIENGAPARRQLSAGPLTIESIADNRMVARITPGDRWPENDSLSAVAAGQPDERRGYQTYIAGFQNYSLQMLPADAMSLVNLSALALWSEQKLSQGQQQAVDQYVRALGGTLVLVGPPSDGGDVLEQLSPLTSRGTDGPTARVILLDASGSMAGEASGANKWGSALNAAVAAVLRLPKDARVTVLRFAGTVRPIATDATPVEALRAIKAAEEDGPSGRTGLRPALQAAADAAVRAGGARVLLITDGQGDFGDAESLANVLTSAKATLYAVTPEPYPALKSLCRATGGDLEAVETPQSWQRTFSAMAAPVDGICAAHEVLTGGARFAGRWFESRERWAASARGTATVILTADRMPAAAVWEVGAGRVVAVAASLNKEDLARLIDPYARPAADPRYAVSLGDSDDELTLTAIENGRPMNGLNVTCERESRSLPLEQIAPGTYRAKLERSAEASFAVVKAEDSIIARLAIPGRYAKEFDTIGNDRPALAKLAKRTGGAVVEAGDNQAMAFPTRTETFGLRTWLAGLAVVTGIGSILAIRSRAAARSGPSPGMAGRG